MAAGLGFKDFVTGEVLTAADVDGYLMQGIWVFADDAARTAAVASPQEGNMSFLKDTNSTEYYSGSAWVAVGAAGGGMTLLSTTTLSGATTNITTISQDYLHLQMIIEGLTLSATDDCLIKQDQPLPFPEYLFSEIEQFTVKELTISLQAPSDNADDSQNSLR